MPPPTQKKENEGEAREADDEGEAEFPQIRVVRRPVDFFEGIDHGV